MLRALNTSETSNEYLLLVVDKASRFLSAYSLLSKEAEGIARLLLGLCLTFGVPSFFRSDGKVELTATVMELKVQIDLGHTDHPWGQGSVEQVGAGMVDVLLELWNGGAHSLERLSRSGMLDRTHHARPIPAFSNDTPPALAWMRPAYVSRHVSA